MRIFVAGATGVLGRPTVEALVRAGHEVRGSARTAEKAAMLREIGAKAESADLFNPLSVSNAISGCQVVINLATKIPPISRMRSKKAWAENDRLRRHASVVLAEAAKKEQVKAYIQESITFLYADGGVEWLTEDSPLDPSWVALESMLEAERATAEFAKSGARGVALRLGAFYALYAQSTRDTIRLAKRRLFPVAGDGANYFSSIHVDDAAAAVAASLDLPSGAYNVVDDEPLTQHEYATAVTSALGVGRPRRVPIWLFKLVAGGPSAYILRSQRVANARFKEATGWVPRYPSARDGWKQIADDYRQR